MFKKHLPLIKSAVTDKTVLAVWVGFIIVSLVILITAILQVQPRELQVVVHYTSSGVTRFYSDTWYYFFAYVGQALLLLIAHSLISLKLLNLKGRNFAIFFLILSIAVAVVIELLYIGLFHLSAKVR